MSEESSTPSATETAADSALTDALANGQAANIGDGLNIQKVPARDAYDILRQEQERRARSAGRRPLFRGINMSGMS